jgi:hypothetical protein
MIDHAGRPARAVFTPKECAKWLKSFAEKVKFEELTEQEAFKALEKAQALGIQGARIYDFWHASVAQKAKADELLTRNTKHFEGLAANVAWP